MKRSWVAGVLGLLLCVLSVSAQADDKKVAKVTRDNFIALDYQSIGGIAALKTQIEISGGEMILEEFPRFGGVGLEGNTGLFSGQSLPSVRPKMRLSNNQLDELISQINKARLPALAGKYSQSNLADGLNETLTLTISDEKNKDQTFIIQNYGNKAPAGFYQFANYLRELRLNKFRGEKEEAVASNLVTTNNLQTLIFETSGGFAGLQDTLEIPFNKATHSSHRFPIFRTQVIGGRKTQSQGGLSAADIEGLIRLINAADLENLNGKSFEQKQLRDGFNEVLTVTLNDGRTFKVSNYGDTAPREYYALLQYLNELKNKTLSTQ